MAIDPRSARTAVPAWVRDAVFYQVFPDRFRNGDPTLDPPGVRPWGALPTAHGFQGGDLRGVLDKLDYLVDLGVDALYLNPIFHAGSNHRYDTTDYRRIDPRLGDLEDFRELVRRAHDHGVRIVLDGVFNHCGRGFFAFEDLLRNQEASRYRDWFHVTRFPIDAFSPGPADDYHAFWAVKSLPKLRTENPEVRGYLLDVARLWIEEGADGWRLDAPDEIGNVSFWAELRDVVRTVNPDAYLLGELRSGDPSWVGPRRFDGLTHYPWRDALLDLLARGTPDVRAFADRAEELLALYPRDHAHAMYLPLGTHDTPRVMTVLRDDRRRVELAFRLQFAWPGAPAIYYGDEIGLTGGRDPGCRGAFPWDPDPAGHELRKLVKRLIAVRRATPTLRRGTLRRVHLDAHRGIYAFARSLETASVLVVVNARDTTRRSRVPVALCGWQDGRVVHDLLEGRKLTVRGGGLDLALPPFGCLWLG